MNCSLHYPRWRSIPARPVIRVEIIENRMEDRARAGDAGYFAHRRTVEISGPDADREFRGETDGPIIAKIRARPGFACDGVIETQGGVHAKGQGARGIVAQDVGDLPNELGPRISARGGIRPREHSPGAEITEAREARIGVGHFEQTRLAIP